MKHAIYPCLWFHNEAREAAVYYCSVFNNARIIEENDFVSNFEVDGQKFMCLNGRHEFAFNPSTSIFVVCESNDEINGLWNEFSREGSVLMPIDKYDWSERYGWIQDKFGVSWQLSVGPLSDVGQKFTPSLLFTGAKLGKAEEAIRHYTSIFENSDIVGIHRYEEGADKGKIAHAQYRLNGNVFMAMESSESHNFDFNESISLVINCDTQEEIDYYWNKLSEGGQESMCGWLKDKYGVSWQVVPSILGALLKDPDKSQQVVSAFMKMRKFDIDILVNA